MPSIHRWLILVFVILSQLRQIYLLVDLRDSDFLDAAFWWPGKYLCDFFPHGAATLFTLWKIYFLGGKEGEGGGRASDQMEGEGPDEIMPDDYNCPFMPL